MTLGKIEPISNSEQLTNKSSSTTNAQNNNSKQLTAKPPVIKWDEESEYPILDELSRIAKVKCSLSYRVDY